MFAFWFTLLVVAFLNSIRSDAELCGIMDDNIAQDFYNLCPGKQKNVKSKSMKIFTPQELGTMTGKKHQNPLYAAQNLSFRLIAVKLKLL